MRLAVLVAALGERNPLGGRADGNTTGSRPELWIWSLTTIDVR
jgi:hypothetical protein